MSETTLGLFEGATPRVRAAPPSAPLLDLLAERIISELARPDEPFAITDTLILLPNRRAARGLMASFAARQEAALLPTIRPLGDLDDDPDVWGADPASFDAPPAIDPLRRRLELAALLRAKARAEGGADDPLLAIAAADELCKLLDAAASAGPIDWTGLPALVADKDLAAHWARSSQFLEIIAKFWPAHLEGQGLMDPAARRTRLLESLADQWTAQPPETPIVIAGSTGSVAAVRRLMGVVARLPRGVVVLPGLDSQMDDAAWAGVTAQHPQFGLRDTLDALGLDRRAIATLTGAEETPTAAARRALVNEALAPADVTADWIARVAAAAKPWGDGAAFLRAATANLSLHTAQTEDEEATIAALALREAMEIPGRTAALVTPNAALAQRVSAKLRRWGLDVAPSAGTALNQTAPGNLIEVLAALTADDSDPVAIAALIKHPLTRFADPAAAAIFDRKFLRGARRRHTLVAFLEEARAEPKTQAALDLLQALDEIVAPLRALFADGDTTLDKLAPALAGGAEAIASPDSPWLGRAGDMAVRFLHELTESGDAIGAITRAQTPRLIRGLMQGRVVSPDADDDPRIAIWGPLEARLQQRDVIVLGGLNEGQWPAPPPEDPFLSRALRDDLDLPPVDARIGLAAHDFAQLANAPRAILTRAQRADGQPSVASRWLWRLEAIVQAAGGALDAEYPREAWARALDAPRSITPASAPTPRPAARKLRIERLSVTDAEKLKRDPYAIYAKRILGLSALDAIGARPGPAERGTAVHDALYAFQKSGADDPNRLLRVLDRELDHAGFSAERRAAYLARVNDAAARFTAWARARNGYAANLEIPGKIEIGAAILTCRADRIDIRPDGWAEIIDYKTGMPPTNALVASGFAPQLLLEAAMLEKGGFAGMAARAAALIYWRFGGGDARAIEVKTEDAADEAARAELAQLGELLEKYDNPRQPFLSRPRVKFLDDPGDYDHLARRQEWADLGAGE